MTRDFAIDYCGSQSVRQASPVTSKLHGLSFIVGNVHMPIFTAKALTENQIPPKIARWVRAALW